MNNIFTTLLYQMEKHHDTVLCTIIADNGSTPRGRGAQMLVGQAGLLCGTIGGGAVEGQTIELGKKLLQERRSVVHEYRLHRNKVEDIGMVCGGDVTVHLQFIAADDPVWKTLAGDVLRRVALRQPGWLTLALILYSLFSGGWALNYSRQTYAQTAGLETKPVEIEKVKALVVSLAQKANDLRAELDTGDEAIALPGTQRQVMRLVKEAYLRAGEKYPWLAGRYGAPKIAILSTPLAYLNIAGIFSPFTVEAHVNAHEGDVLLAATAAHEAAHLRGFAREDEANFIAYQVCMESEEVYVRYSGTMLALIYAGNALAKQNMEMYSEIYATYSEGVRADLAAYRKSWEPYKGEAAEIHNKVNDAYLKANNQTDGVQSYGRMVDLLIAEYEKEKSAAAE